MLTKIYLCPSDKKYGCSWEGQSDDILEHFMQEHEDILYYTNSVDINLDVASENCLIFVDTEIYLLQTKVIESYLCIFLRYLGPAKIAEKITFDIDLFSSERKLEKQYIQMKDGCFSISLDNMQTHFGKISVINCQLLISGDFKSSSSDDGVFLEDDTSLDKEEVILDKTDLNETTHSEVSSDIPVINEEEKLEENLLSEKLQFELRPSLPTFDEKEEEEQIICKEPPQLEHKPTSPILERTLSAESATDFSHYLKDLFSTPKNEYPPTESHAARPKSYIEEGSRSTWYEDFTESELSRTEPSSLQRSKTFGADDVRKRNQIRRHPSMRSLGAIRESDSELELRCLNCDSHLAPPIFLCESDHSICANCYRDHELCTICECKITADRNMELEEKSIDYHYYCKNKKNGCPQKLTYLDICAHEINCTFCFYNCPMEECGYRGPYKSMSTHLKLIHSSVKMFESFIAVFQKQFEVFLANEKMGIFYCTVKILDDRVAWNAKYCGPKERKFFCELKFKGKNFKTPFLLAKHDDCYIKEIPISVLKEYKVKSKNSILAITR